MKILSLNNISKAEWHILPSTRSLVEQQRSNSQLINMIMRFQNLTTLTMLVPGVTNLNTRYLFENCSKLNNIELCHCPSLLAKDTIFDDIKENCKQIQFIRVVGPCGKYHTGQDTVLSLVRSLFPNVKVQVKKWKEIFRKFKQSIFIHFSSFQFDRCSLTRQNKGKR